MVTMITTFSDALQHEVKQERQDEKKQQKNQLNALGFHSGLAYCFGVAVEWPFPVSAIASRMAVSACTFFIL